MGSGIAQLTTLGNSSTIDDPSPVAREGGEMRFGEDLSRGVERERWDEEEAEAAIDRLATAHTLDDLATCDLVIEAVPEDLDLKRKLFKLPGRGVQAGGDPCHQYLVSFRHRDRRRHPPPRANRRHALLQPTAADEAGRDRRRRRVERSGTRCDHGGRSPYGPNPDPRPRQHRLHRQPPRPPLRVGGPADARRGDRKAGDNRPRLPPRRRLPDGAVRADRPDRPRRQSQRRPLLLRARRPAGALAAEPDPGRAGGRRPDRPQDRPWLLRIRRPRRRRTRSRSRDRGTDPRPWRTFEDRPWRRADPAADNRPDHQRGGLRPGRADRLPRRHEHGDATRLQLAARPDSSSPS